MCLPLLPRIHYVRSPKLETRPSILTDVFRNYAQPVQEEAGVAPQVRPRLLPIYAIIMLCYHYL
jgi:hypothetical protein